MRGFLVIFLYLAGAAAALAAARRREPRPALREPALYLAWAAVVAHATWVADAVGPWRDLQVGLADGASLMGLAIGAAGFVAIVAQRFRAIAVVVLCLAALLAAGTGAMSASREVASEGWPIAVHVVLAMGAAGMLAVSAVLASLLVLQDAELKSRRPSKWVASLPPVESLERAHFAVIAVGWAALSVAILAGLLFVTDLFAQHLVHKTVLALAAWAIFACLLFGRWQFGWRGRLAARYTIAGFFVLVLAYFGSKFVLEVLLERHWG